MVRTAPSPGAHALTVAQTASRRALTRASRWRRTTRSLCAMQRTLRSRHRHRHRPCPQCGLHTPGTTVNVTTSSVRRTHRARASASADRPRESTHDRGTRRTHRFGSVLQVPPRDRLRCMRRETCVDLHGNGKRQITPVLVRQLLPCPAEPLPSPLHFPSVTLTDSHTSQAKMVDLGKFASLGAWVMN